MSLAAARLASEIVGFAMLFGIVAAAGAALLHFVGEGLESAGEASESAMRQRISRLGETLRVIRSEAPESAAPSPWTARVEAVNAGDSDMVVEARHSSPGGTITSTAGCATMQRVGAPGDGGACVLAAGRLSDLRFSPAPSAGISGDAVGILVITRGGNAIWLVGGP